MDKCGICEEIKKVKNIWSMPLFKNSGLIACKVAGNPLANNNICEDCAKELLDIGRINGKNGYGYRLSLEYQRERYKERNKIN